MRWYAPLLLAQGWTASAAADALERGPDTIGRWTAAFGESGPTALIFKHSGGPPVLGEAEQAALKGAVQELPETSGIEMANWNCKVVRQFVAD